MTPTLLAAANQSTASDVTEPLPWEISITPEASTYLELETVANPALRDVLAYFAAADEPLLRLSETVPGAVVLRRAVNNLVDQRIRLFVSGIAVDADPSVKVWRWLASATGELLQTDDAAWIDAPGSALATPFATAEEVRLDHASDVVEVVEWLAKQLEVPDMDIIAAAKIKPRNWFNWKNGRRPRLDTQGQLWALLNTVKTLSDVFENGPASWFKEGGAERRALLTSGQHRKLVQQALKEASMRGDFDNESRRTRRRKSAAGSFE